MNDYAQLEEKPLQEPMARIKQKDLFCCIICHRRLKSARNAKARQAKDITLRTHRTGK